MIKPAKGNAPSGTSVKPCSTISLPDVSTLNMVPQPSPEQPERSPPNEVVPYRLPFLSMTKPAKGASPSVPEFVKLYNKASVPEVSSLNTVPKPEVPPPAVVP